MQTIGLLSEHLSMAGLSSNISGQMRWRPDTLKEVAEVQLPTRSGDSLPIGGGAEGYPDGTPGYSAFFSATVTHPSGALESGFFAWQSASCESPRLASARRVRSLKAQERRSPQSVRPRAQNRRLAPATALPTCSCKCQMAFPLIRNGNPCSQWLAERSN